MTTAELNLEEWTFCADEYTSAPLHSGGITSKRCSDKFDGEQAQLVLLVWILEEILLIGVCCFKALYYAFCFTLT